MNEPITFTPSSSINTLPFIGKKVYYAGSIKGAPELDPTFAWKLVTYMLEQGATVLSEHVAAPSHQEMRNLFAKNTGKSIAELYESEQGASIIRKQCLTWVEQATHMVALVNAPSLGVGMEIERALMKPYKGLPATPILCLVHAEVQDNLSNMIKGVTHEESSVFFVKSYSNVEDAYTLIHNFLRGSLSFSDTLLSEKDKCFR